MNIVIMAGGMGGSRLSNPNKPLVNVCGKPMIEHIASVVSEFGKTYIATTVRHTEVINWARQHGREVLITSGAGYSKDLLESLLMVGTPTMFVPGDTPPLITRELIRKFLAMAAYVTSPMITLMYEKDGEVKFTGISLVKRLEVMHGSYPGHP